VTLTCETGVVPPEQLFAAALPGPGLRSVACLQRLAAQQRCALGAGCRPIPPELWLPPDATCRAGPR